MKHKYAFDDLSLFTALVHSLLSILWVEAQIFLDYLSLSAVLVYSPFKYSLWLKPKYVFDNPSLFTALVHSLLSIPCGWSPNISGLPEFISSAGTFSLLNILCGWCPNMSLTSWVYSQRWIFLLHILCRWSPNISRQPSSLSTALLVHSFLITDSLWLKLKYVFHNPSLSSALVHSPNLLPHDNDPSKYIVLKTTFRRDFQFLTGHNFQDY